MKPHRNRTGPIISHYTTGVTVKYVCSNALVNFSKNRQVHRGFFEGGRASPDDAKERCPFSTNMCVTQSLKVLL